MRGFSPGRATTALTCLPVSLASSRGNLRQSFSPFSSAIAFSFFLFPFHVSSRCFHSLSRTLSICFLTEVVFTRACARSLRERPKWTKKGGEANFWSVRRDNKRRAPARLLRKGICKSNLRLAFSPVVVNLALFFSFLFFFFFFFCVVRSITSWFLGGWFSTERSCSWNYNIRQSNMFYDDVTYRVPTRVTFFRKFNLAEGFLK